ncbi:hypothetical protein JMUB7529_28470 [Staphylococcus aureus]
MSRGLGDVYKRQHDITGGVNFMDQVGLQAVSYTHLTLPTKA